MQVMFVRWCLDPQGRTEVTVNPERVDCTEFYSEAIEANNNREAFPPCTKIVMRNKIEYLVQGALEEVQGKLNDADRERITIDIPGTFPWKEKR